MDSDERFDLTDDARRDAEQETADTAYDTSPSGLAGVPEPDVTEETSKSGVAGSSTFDPRVSPAHEGLAGSPSRHAGDYDPELHDTSDRQRDPMDDDY